MKRQAVVVIHGIGEQKPMSTLRGFVDSLSDYANEKEWIQVYNVPDSLSAGYELRQFSVYRGKDLRTDFYEYYWAFNMRGTKLGAVAAWLVQLMLRKPKNIPRRILWLYLLMWEVALIYAGLLITGGVNWIQNAEWTQLPIVIFIGNICLNILAVVLTLFLGDAARYTYAAPGNIEERNKIRKGGIDLLDRLHKSGLYSRIIVVGHSLGSMIAYDILKHYWAQVGKDYRVTPTYSKEKLDTYNEQIKKGFELSDLEQLKAYMKLQSDLLAEQQSRGNPWLVTDLVTLGSPLTYGELLMAESKVVFKERKDEREFPTNPPHQERDGGISYSRFFKDIPGKMDIIHHSGHFAFTRWHNLYYAFDFVGGPLRNIFGKGILDKVVKSNSWKARVPFLMHTNYWGEPKKSKEGMRESVEYLKGVVFRKE